MESINLAKEFGIKLIFTGREKERERERERERLECSSSFFGPPIGLFLCIGLILHMVPMIQLILNTNL